MTTHTTPLPNNYKNPYFSLAVTLTILVLFALVLRLHHLDFESLFMDEIRQVSFYKNNFKDIITNAINQQQPPLDYWIGHIFYFYSESDFSVRLPAAIFGTSSVLLITLLIAQLANWPIAICFGFIYSLLPFSIYFSQDARPYSISIFFFLAMLLQLNHLLVSKVNGLKQYFFLAFIAYCFLLTRTLTPLVIITALLFILFTSLAYKTFKKGHLDSEIRRRAFILMPLLLALIFYLPLFMKILRAGSSYAPEATSLNGQLLFKAIDNFSIAPLWPAFVVQTEPLTWLILITTVIGILLTIFVKKIRRNVLVVSVSALLPVACLLHLFIFQAYTNEAFRPPYAIYLAPLCLLLSAISVNWLWQLAGNILPATSFRIMTTSCFFIIAVFLGITLIDFKDLRIKSDWRGLITSLSRNHGKNHVYMTHTFSNVTQWGPGLYGINRYQVLEGPIVITDPDYIHALPDLGLNADDWKPVLVFFHYRNYYLTSDSRYGVFPLNHPDPAPLSSFVFHPEIVLDEFTGFSVISLKTGNGNFYSDMLLLLDNLLQNLQQDPSSVDLYLTLAYLEKICGKPASQFHLDLASKLSNEWQRSKVIKMTNILIDLKENKNIGCSDAT